MKFTKSLLEILVINELKHKFLFYDKFILCLYMFRALLESSVLTSSQTKNISVSKTNKLEIFREVIAVNSLNHMK